MKNTREKNGSHYKIFIKKTYQLLGRLVAEKGFEPLTPRV